MKECPKCKINHSNSSKYCSRSCANSREWTEESNKKRSLKLSGRKPTGTIADLEKWKANIKKAWLEKYQAKTFEELGPINKRRRVFEEQEYSCAKCGIKEWQGYPISLELDHKDGNRNNDIRDNLEGLCPNCHSVTDTWRGRNKPSKNGLNVVTDEYLLECLSTTKTIRQGLLKAGLAAKGNNYARAKKLLKK